MNIPENHVIRVHSLGALIPDEEGFANPYLCLYRSPRSTSRNEVGMYVVTCIPVTLNDKSRIDPPRRFLAPVWHARRRETT